MIDRRRVALMLFAAAVSAAMTVRAVAQDRPAPTPSPDASVLTACYVPPAGIVYRIKGPGLPDHCFSPRHVEFSWNEHGAAGPAGLACWDLDGDGVADPAEDRNGDGAVDALDCAGPAGPAGPPGAALCPQRAPGPTGPAILPPTRSSGVAAGLDPLIGEVILFAGNFPPRGWAFAEGQLLPISQYQALFSILGTTYGGDGRTTFALPDTRGTEPECMHYIIALQGIFPSRN